MPNNATRKIFYALADSSRYHLFTLIIEYSAYYNAYEDKPLSLNYAKKLAELSGLSPATLAHHFKILKQAGLIYSLKKGKIRYLFPREDTIELLGELGKEILLQYREMKKNSAFAQIKFFQGSSKALAKAMSFLAIHGFKYYGPSTFIDNPMAVKYLVILRTEKTGFMEIIYHSREAKIYLNKPGVRYDWIESKGGEVKKILEQYILKNLVT